MAQGAHYTSVFCAPELYEFVQVEDVLVESCCANESGLVLDELLLGRLDGFEHFLGLLEGSGQVPQRALGDRVHLHLGVVVGQSDPGAEQEGAPLEYELRNAVG